MPRLLGDRPQRAPGSPGADGVVPGRQHFLSGGGCGDRPCGQRFRTSRGMGTGGFFDCWPPGCCWRRQSWRAVFARRCRPARCIPATRSDYASWFAWTLGMIVGSGAVGVGLAGLIYHLQSGFFQQQTLRNLVYAAPFAAPLSYAGLGLWRSSIARCPAGPRNGPDGLSFWPWVVSWATSSSALRTMPRMDSSTAANGLRSLPPPSPWVGSWRP